MNKIYSNIFLGALFSVSCMFSRPVLGQSSDALQTLCYRDRTITVPAYLVQRYLTNGAKLSSCPGPNAHELVSVDLNCANSQASLNMHEIWGRPVNLSQVVGSRAPVEFKDTGTGSLTQSQILAFQNQAAKFASSVSVNVFSEPQGNLLFDAEYDVINKVELRSKSSRIFNASTGDGKPAIDIYFISTNPNSSEYIDFTIVYGGRDVNSSDRDTSIRNFTSDQKVFDGKVLFVTGNSPKKGAAAVLVGANCTVTAKRLADSVFNP